MIHLALPVLTVAAFLCLCAADGRHQAALLGARLSRTVSGRLKLSGWALLVVAAVVAVRKLGWAYGLVELLGASSVGALATVAILSRPMRKRPR